MDPVIGGALIGGASSLLSNIFGSSNARSQMDFQERMSNTAYQRGVKDMQKAGLNPMLAYSQGGASTPIGSMPQVHDLGAGAAGGAAAAVQALQAKANVDLTNAQSAKLKSETFDSALNSAFRYNELLKLQEETNKTFMDTQKSSSETQLTDVVKKLRELELARDQGSFSADVAKRRYDSAVAGYGVPEAKARADFFGTKLGESTPGLRVIMEMLKGLMVLKGK